MISSSSSDADSPFDYTFLFSPLSARSSARLIRSNVDRKQSESNSNVAIVGLSNGNESPIRFRSVGAATGAAIQVLARHTLTHSVGSSNSLIHPL